jgi:hypothetical protein
MTEFDMADKYYNELSNNPLYIRLKELNEIIKKEYGLLIIGFKTNESYYNEALEKNYPKNVIEELKKKYIDSKIALQSKPLVKEYKELELKINEMINNDFNEIKSSISNKFKLTTSITL